MGDEPALGGALHLILQIGDVVVDLLAKVAQAVGRGLVQFVLNAAAAPRDQRKQSALQYQKADQKNNKKPGKRRPSEQNPPPPDAAARPACSGGPCSLIWMVLSYSFTLPRTRPLAKYFCRKGYTHMMGKMARKIFAPLAPSAVALATASSSVMPVSPTALSTMTMERR